MSQRTLDRREKAAAVRIVAYLKNRTDELPALSEKERSHLSDVRDAFGLGFSAFTLSLLLLAITALALTRVVPAKDIWRLVVIAAGAGITALTALFAAMLINFSGVFARFHGLFFTGGSWLFAGDATLIRLFPGQFWARAGLHWVLLTMAELALLAVAAVLAKRRRD